MFKAISRRIVTIVGISALSVAGFGFLGTAAHAEPTSPTETNLGCGVSIAGAYRIYPAGTRITVDIGDGQTETFVCDGLTGEWVKETIQTGTTGTIGTFPLSSLSKYRLTSTSTTSLSTRVSRVTSTTTFSR